MYFMQTQWFLHEKKIVKWKGMRSQGWVVWATLPWIDIKEHLTPTSRSEISHTFIVWFLLEKIVKIRWTPFEFSHAIIIVIFSQFYMTENTRTGTTLPRPLLEGLLYICSWSLFFSGRPSFGTHTKKIVFIFSSITPTFELRIHQQCTRWKGRTIF